MTAPDARTAAQAEADAHVEAMRAARKYAPDDIEAQSDFACGYLVADRARVTPTREQIAMTVAQFFGPDDTPEDVADAVLKLMAGLAEGERQ